MHSSSLKSGLLWELRKPSMRGITVLAVQLAVDGVPPARNTVENMMLSASQVVWPVVGTPGLVAGWQGLGKPDPHSYFSKTMLEMKNLKDEGICHPVTCSPSN